MPEAVPDQDPFRHHPELRGKIRPAAECFFRDVDLAIIDADAAEAGFPPDWRTPDDQREAGRNAWLADHRDGDLWVFAYGSLMWDPGLEFAEVRRGAVTGYTRSFCLWDEGGRGSKAQPGLMAAIDAGTGCEGLVFRIEQEKLEHETFVLFRREMIAPAYRPVWVEVATAPGPVQALSFAANHESDDIVTGIALDEQARMIANAHGFLGSNFSYLDDMQAHLALLGIEDAYVRDLHERAVALRATG